MPPLPPISNVYRAVLNLVSNGQNVANVMHFTLPSAGATAVLTELAGGLDAWWVANIRLYVPTTLSLKTIDVTDLGPANVSSISFTPPAARVGGGASPALPNNVSLCMTVRTGTRGRSFRGRIFHVGLMEAQVTGDAVDAATVTTLKNAYGALMNLAGSPNGTIYKLGVLSYYAAGQIRVPPVFTPAVSIETDGYVDSQRRRLTGRGR